MMEMLHVTKMPTEAKDKLLYAALQLFTTKGFKETSILEVVEQARVSKTTFYRFFRSKEELLVCLFELLANEVLKEVEEAVRQEEQIAYKGYAGIRRYIEICVNRSTVAKLLLVESVGVSKAVERMRRTAHLRFADLIDRIVQEILPPAKQNQDARIISQAMVGAINEVVMQNLFQSDEKIDTDHLARLLNRIMVSSYVNFSFGKSAGNKVRQ
jgi:AcrR family transcriptional regulator